MLNVLYVPYNSEKIRYAYKSNHNKECENQVIFLMITDSKKMTLSCSEKIVSTT